MLKHRVAYATLAAALAACGTEETRLPPTTPVLENPVEYFALQPCTCWEYARPDGTGARLGIAIETVTTEVIGSGGQEEILLSYRVGGREERRDVLRTEGNELLLRQARVGSITSTTWVADPPLPWLTFPVEPRSQSIEAESTLSEIVGGAPMEVDFRADYTATTVEGSRDGGATEETFEAVRLRYQGLPFDQGLFRSFVPELGWVQVEMELDGTRTNYVLQNVRTLGGNCPVALGETPTDICGVID